MAEVLSWQIYNCIYFYEPHVGFASIAMELESRF